MDILSNMLVSRRGRFLGGQNCSAWRAKNSGGRVYRPSSGTTTRTRTRTRTRTGLKYLRSRRDNAHAPARISPLLHLRFLDTLSSRTDTRPQKCAAVRVFRLPFKANIPPSRASSKGPT